MTTGRRLGVLGGTFDPIHVGHLAMAEAVGLALALDEILLIPSNTPPHRRHEPVASVFHRFAMVAIAASPDRRLVACDLEVQRGGLSYTADTLRALHASGCDELQLFLITGADAFAEIATWREYPGILALAHFVVCARPGLPATSLPARLPDLAARMRPLACGDAFRAIEPQPRVFLLDCPTPDVSSTDIRARARAGRPLTGLVPPDVDSYIRRHGLYGAPTEVAPVEQTRGRQLA